MEYISTNITELKPNEIFVFVSNLQRQHAGGAAHIAHVKFGAIIGLGVELQGQSYAIPTMHCGVRESKPYVDQFIQIAKLLSQYKFYVTRIGCGIARFKDTDIAPLFTDAIDGENIVLPKEFVEVISSTTK